MTIATFTVSADQVQGFMTELSKVVDLNMCRVGWYPEKGIVVEMPDSYEPTMARKTLEEGYWLIGLSTIVKEVRSAADGRVPTS